jgi:multisubunit Na+/H+ antiporter MnhB subunit
MTMAVNMAANMAAVFDIALVGLLLAIAVWVVASRTAFSAVVVFVVYGLLVAIAWVRLFAVDVALTEAAIGSGLTGMLLLGAAGRLRGVETAKRSGVALRLAAAMFCAVISIGLAAIIVVPPKTVFTLAPAAMAHLAESGLGNPVAGVLFVYRAFDTLLEKVVLLLALLGVWSLTPDRFWGGVPGLYVDARRNGLLTFLAQLLPPIGIMVGIYMTWTGADHPGGAFQGGTVLAAMWILLMTAGLRDVPAIGRRSLRLLVVIGPLLFLAIGLMGFVLADAFLAYPAGYAKPLIIVVEAALTLSIAVTLGLVAAGPPNRMQHK